MRVGRIAITAGLVVAWALVVAGAVLAEATWFARPNVTRGDPTSIEAHLVAKLREATARRRLGSAALALIQGGRIVAEHAFGAANAETLAPVDPDRTLFVVASVSKAVTAWGVMKLVEQGRLALDEPVMGRLKRWRFPGSEALRDQVTVRHLLSHTAGLDDGLGYGGFPPGEKPQSLEESLTSTADSTVGPPRPVRVAWKPGTAMAYSGGGYAVLQLLIEEVTGRSFADFMRDTVLRPLGMTTASFEWDAIVAEGRAGDVAPDFDGDLTPRPHRRYSALAAVALHATVDDLARFALAYTGDNPVLRRDTLELMSTPQRGTGGSWGLGQTLFAPNGAGGHVVGHDGGTGPAWGAMLRVNPASGNGMVLVTSGGEGAVNRLGHDWIYWETGAVTDDARRQVAQDRLASAAAAVALGGIALALWRRSPKARAV